MCFPEACLGNHEACPPPRRRSPGPAASAFAHPRRVGIPWPPYLSWRGRFACRFYSFQQPLQCGGGRATAGINDWLPIRRRAGAFLARARALCLCLPVYFCGGRWKTYMCWVLAMQRRLKTGEGERGGGREGEGQGGGSRTSLDAARAAAAASSRQAGESERVRAPLPSSPFTSLGRAPVFPVEALTRPKARRVLLENKAE